MEKLRKLRADVQEQFDAHYEIFEQLCQNGVVPGTNRRLKKSSLRHGLAHEFHERCKAYQDVLDMIDEELKQ